MPIFNLDYLKANKKLIRKGNHTKAHAVYEPTLGGESLIDRVVFYTKTPIRIKELA